MYIRSIGESLESLAGTLRIPDPRERLIQSTVQIMLCLDPEPRCFLVDAQTFLVENGLATLRTRRRCLLESLEAPLPSSLETLEAVACSMDALRFADLARTILPGLREERWRIARAVLVNEGGVRGALDHAVADPAQAPQAEGALREMVFSLHQNWMDRAGAIRNTCLHALQSISTLEPDEIHPEADLLFELFATSDDRATALLEAVDRDPLGAFDQVSRLEELAMVLRSVGADGSPDPGGGSGLRDVA